MFSDKARLDELYSMIMLETRYLFWICRTKVPPKFFHVWDEFSIIITLYSSINLFMSPVLEHMAKDKESSLRWKWNMPFSTKSHFLVLVIINEFPVLVFDELMRDAINASSFVNASSFATKSVLAWRSFCEWELANARCWLAKIWFAYLCFRVRSMLSIILPSVVSLRPEAGLMKMSWLNLPIEPSAFSRIHSNCSDMYAYLVF